MRTTRLLLASLIVSGGCGFSGSQGESPDATMPGGADGPVDPPWQSNVDFLPDSEETFVDVDWTIDANTLLSTTLIDVTSGPMPPNGVTIELGLQESGDQLVVLRVRTLKINNNATLSVQGVRPLVVLADEIVLDGTLDASAQLNVAGPGGGSGGTGAGAGKISTHDDGTGSGFDDSGPGGGSFGTAGAAGGKVGKFLGGAGGDAYALTTKLTGGGPGGLANACINLPGGGGGAVLLYAKKRIRINGGGAINAGGGGGSGGVTSCPTGAGPGSGGGAGGAIWVQTPALEGDGLLAANGGGGGGASYLGVGNGGNGGNGLASTTMAAMGGSKANSTEASVGGNGAIEGTPASMVPDLIQGNAGGGGGGLGRIVARAKTIAPSLRSSPAIVKAPAQSAR